MASPDETISRRGFTPLAISVCHGQSAADRFGPDATDAIRKRERALVNPGPDLDSFGPLSPLLWPDSQTDIDNDPTTLQSIYQVIPTPQSYRNNLTALSDIYNLYFVAYQNRVYVYTPQGGAQSTLRRDPDLQLREEISLEGGRIGGYLDNFNRVQGRSINHMITGFLGNNEILVHCSDNGDVVAYYTKHIARMIFKKYPTPDHSNGVSGQRGLREPKKEKCKVRPFFTANVLQSAWGLAIHQKSRLIAVSSNRAEVTVFAFALSSGSSPGPPGKDCNGIAESPESYVRLRERNWTIILELPQEADNIPNICFLDGEGGLAEKIAAIDIKGVTWVADIWKPLQPVVLIPPCKDPDFTSEEFFPDRTRGWGILALRDAHFMKVDTVGELVGVNSLNLQFKDPKIKAYGGCEATALRADLSPSLKDIPGNPYIPSAFPDGGGMINPGDEMGPIPDPFPEPESEAESDDEIDEESDDESDDENDDESDDESYAGSHIESHVEGSDEGLEEDLEGQLGDNSENVEGDLDEDDEFTSIETASEADNNQFQPSQNPNLPPPNPSANGASVDELDYLFQAPFNQLLETVGLMNEAFDQLDELAEHDHEEAVEGAVQPTPLDSMNDYMWGLRPSFRPRESWYAGDAPLHMMYWPHNGNMELAPMIDKYRRLLADRPNFFRVRHERPKEKPWGVSHRLGSEYHLLRTYEKDFEMVRLPEKNAKANREISVICTNAMCCESLRDNRTRRFFRATSRLSMLAHIPELSLVILGSPTGRVLLVTLTRLRRPEPYPEGQWEWDRGMRIESFLPSLEDERKYRQGTTARPLYGVAVGRLPQVGDGLGEDGRGPATLPRRYRIMLHYQNHLILSYVLMRSEEGQKILVF